MSEITYLAQIHRPDGVTIRVTIQAPEDRRDVGELGEVAQMGAAHTNGTLDRTAAAFIARADMEMPF